MQESIGRRVRIINHVQILCLVVSLILGVMSLKCFTQLGTHRGWRYREYVSPLSTLSVDTSIQ